MAKIKCSHVRGVYGFKKNAEGKEELCKIGETNIYNEIQANRQGTEICDILRSLSRGDTSVLGQQSACDVDAAVRDMTKVPKNLIEAFSIAQNAQNTFNSLPAEVRKKYNNNIQNFLASVDDGSFIENFIKPHLEKVEDNGTETQKTDKSDI